jgi:hypothetical protein
MEALVKTPSVAEIDAAAQILRAPLKYKVHLLCSVYPDYSPEALAEQAADVKANGLRDKITFTPDDLLLDGKNRVRACELAGVEITPEMIEVHHGDPLAFVVSKNDHRRHLTDEQRRAARAKLAALVAAETEAGAGGDRRSESFKSAAADLKDEKGVKSLANDVSNFRAVQAHGTSEEQAAVKSGKASLRGVADQVRARARKALKPADDDSIDVVAHELVAKCSAQWLTAPKMAAVVRQAESVVREALKLLESDGRLERRTAAGAAAIEFWISDARVPAPNFEERLGQKDAEIAQLTRENVDLTRQVAERDDEIADLKRRVVELASENARLKARLGDEPEY